MKFSIGIAWRGFRWTLNGRARSSGAMLEGIAPYAPPDAKIIIRPHEDEVNRYAEHMIRRDIIESYTGRPS